MVETWENPEFILSCMAKAKLQKLPVFLRRRHVKTKNVNKRVKLKLWILLFHNQAVVLFAGSLENNFYCLKHCSPNNLKYW